MNFLLYSERLDYILNLALKGELVRPRNSPENSIIYARRVIQSNTAEKIKKYLMRK